MLLVTNLNLEPMRQLTDLPLNYILIGVFIVSFTAIAVMAFTEGWVGIIIGYVLLLGMLGALGYIALDFKASLIGSGVDTKNVSRIESWADDNYGVKLTDTTATELIGTATSAPLTETKQAIRFGSTTVVNPEKGSKEKTAEVTLIHVKGQWKLGTINDKNEWIELDVKK